MKADPKLGEAIGRSLQIVITLHEASKARRVAAKRWRYRRIYAIFDRQSDVTSDWRRWLEKLAARYQLPLNINLNTQDVDSDAPQLDHLQAAYREMVTARKSFMAGYDVANDLDIRPAKRRFNKLLDRCECQIERMEAYARQVEEQGAALWLSDMM